jgi:hypothetical protein
MRIYFDENFSPNLVLGMRAFQDGRKSEDIVVCSVADEFGTGSPDEHWIPSIAQRHGVALTQDLNIHRSRAQWSLCEANKIGVFFFKPPAKTKAWSYWDVVQLVVRHWPEIKRLSVETERPFGFVIDKSKFFAL